MNQPEREADVPVMKPRRKNNFFMKNIIMALKFFSLALDLVASPPTIRWLRMNARCFPIETRYMYKGAVGCFRLSSVCRCVQNIFRLLMMKRNKNGDEIDIQSSVGFCARSVDIFRGDENILKTVRESV